MKAPSEEKEIYIRQMNARNTVLQCTFSCLQRCRWQYWSI